jgi:DNA-binding NarL/FixJ family response regulator
MEPLAPRTTTPHDLGLTRREREILASVTQGKTNREIAEVRLETGAQPSGKSG